MKTFLMRSYCWYITMLAASFVTVAGMAWATPSSNPTSLRLDQLQVIGSHNSYHAGVNPGILAQVRQSAPDLAQLLEYAHPSLATQLDLGVRQLELDVYADSHGGRFANPHRPGHPEEKWPLLPNEAALMRQPGFKVMHIPDIDQHANCQPFKACLQEIHDWSRAHPGHVPVFVILEIEQSNDIPGATPVERFTPLTFDMLDSTIRSVFAPDELLTPDDVRGHEPTLATAIAAHGWPTLADSRGRVVFLLDQRSNSLPYLKGHAALMGRVAFTNASPDAPDAAFTELNDGPASQITTLVRRHLLVRTRADVNTIEARSGDTVRRDVMLASGAQIVSTDFPDGEPASWSGYRVGFPAGGPVRCNPVSAPSDCVSRLIDPTFRDGLHLQRVIMVMRHGIRSALSGQEPKTASPAGGWPRWEVAGGDLTPHGAAGMRANGRFARQWLDENGVVPAQGCPAPGILTVHANSEPRTISSAQAFANGFAPACAVTIMHLAPGVHDPIFSPLDADPDRFDMRAIVPQLPDAAQAFASHQDVLHILGQLVRCNNGLCNFITTPAHVEPNASNHGLKLSGSIREGSSIAEALMLAYLDGKPEIPDGKIWVDADLLGQLSVLHATMLDTIVRPPAIAEPQSRDLRRYLLRDLSDESGVGLRLYVGHDDTIAPLLGLMDTHIRAPGYAADEIPVGSALGFAVYGNDTGRTNIRVFFQSQRPEDLRTHPESAMPSVSFPVVPGCTGKAGLCTLDELRTIFQAEPVQDSPPSRTHIE